MTLTQLEYIVALDNYRHFVTASEKCFVTQPTLSMQIQKLEQELDVVIFDRKKQPIEPTVVGQEIIRRARAVLREARGIKDFIKSERGIVEGELKIGIIPTLAPYLIPRFLIGFIQKYPKLRPVIEESQTQELLQKLYTDKIDMAILVTPIQEKGLEEIPLFEETFVAYLSENHALLEKQTLSLKDLESKDLWILNEGHCFRNQVMNLCQFQPNQERQFVYESGSLETLSRMVELEFGYTLLPQLATLTLEGREHLLRYFENPQPVRQVSLMVKRGFLKRHLIDMVKQAIWEGLPQAIKNPKAPEQKKVVRWS